MSDSLPKLLQEIHSTSTPNELQLNFENFQSRISAILYSNPLEYLYYSNHTGRELYRKLYNFGLNNLITTSYDSGFRPNPKSSLWLPSEASTKAWYDVSDNSTLTINSGIVEAIADKSLNNNSLLAGSSSVKNQTLIPGGQNSLDVVSMDGDDNYVAQNMNLPSSGNLCIFMVCKIDAIDSPLDSILSAIGPTSFQFAAGNVSEFRGQLAANGIGGSNTGVSTHGNLGGVYRIFALTMDFTSSQQCLIYADGTDITNTPIAYTTKLGSPKTFRVFANRANAENPSGFISEVVFVENTDETTRQKMEGYMAHKWGLSSNLPTNHPYKISFPLTAD